MKESKKKEKGEAKRKARRKQIEQLAAQIAAEMAVGLFGRTEEYAEHVAQYYTAAVDALLKLSASTELDAESEVFSFNSSKRMSEKSNAILRGLYSAVYQEIRSGVIREWEHANNDSDRMVELVFGKGTKDDSRFARLFARNREAMEAFFRRKNEHGGLNLSQKVWKYTSQFKEEMELALSVSLGRGDSAATVSRHVRQYLKEPDKLFRRVRDAEGNLKLSKRAAAYHPGRGEYRSSYKNAMRLARTETNMAYRYADYERRQRHPWIVGFEVKRVQDKTDCPLCDTLAGKYPKDFKFPGWHPQCRCYTIDILAPRDEVTAYHRAMLNGEDVSDWQFSGQITEPHKGFQKWIGENQERIENAKSLPYWMKDNPKYVNGTMHQIEEVSNHSILEPVKSRINSVADQMTDRQVHEKEVLDFLNEKFGDESVKGVFDGFYVDRMNFEGSIMRTVTQKMDDGSYRHRILISNTSMKVIGVDGKETTFNAMRELQGAMEAIRNKQPLTFNQEYALESVWHELRHAKAKNWRVLRTEHDDHKIVAMEVVNQLCARRTYAGFLKKIGIEAQHYETVLNHGYGYKQEITNLRTIFGKFNINEEEFFNHFKSRIVENDYDMIFDNLVKFLRAKKVKRAEGLVKMLNLDNIDIKKFMDGI